MQLFLRLLLITVKLIVLLLYSVENVINLVRRRPKGKSELPAISSRLLTLRLSELRQKLRTRQLTCVELIEVYIDRIKTVNPYLNAVVEPRFEAALAEAAATDKLIETSDDVEKLFKAKPLLGLPVTVKESCALGGMSFAVGSLARSQFTAPDDGVVVARVRAAGAIPLLVSATPEYCYSDDTDTLLNGRCLNPYNFACTSGGSSGGEGSLNGAGASLFGIGSDIGGSIRIPSLFCGIFGHKPTGGVVTAEGHFPHSSDADIEKHLVMGPMTRFATDLNPLLEIMAGNNAEQLRLRQTIELNKLKVYYALDYAGLNGHMHIPVEESIQDAILRAITYLKGVGLGVERLQMPDEFSDSLEISLGGVARLVNMPFVLDARRKVLDTLIEIIRSFCGKSKYTRNALIFDLMRRTNAFMPASRLEYYKERGQSLLQKLTLVLGENGVLLFPTMHTAAPRHGWSTLHLWGIDYPSIFNILGLPVTHVPMGVNKQGLPIGFSVVAAPNQDRLCIRVAVELERAFGGWRPTTAYKLI